MINILFDLQEMTNNELITNYFVKPASSSSDRESSKFKSLHETSTEIETQSTILDERQEFQISQLDNILSEDPAAAQPLLESLDEQGCLQLLLCELLSVPAHLQSSVGLHILDMFQWVTTIDQNCYIRFKIFNNVAVNVLTRCWNLVYYKTSNFYFFRENSGSKRDASGKRDKSCQDANRTCPWKAPKMIEIINSIAGLWCFYSALWGTQYYSRIVFLKLLNNFYRIIYSITHQSLVGSLAAASNNVILT